MFGVYLSLRATDKLMAKLFRITFYIVNRPNVHGMPKFCACENSNSKDHALSCMKGGFSVLRHNNVRDTEAEIPREVCNDVTIEPALILSDNVGDRSKHNIGCRNFGAV